MISNLLNKVIYGKILNITAVKLYSLYLKDNNPYNCDYYQYDIILKNDKIVTIKDDRKNLLTDKDGFFKRNAEVIIQRKLGLFGFKYRIINYKEVNKN